MDKVSTVFYGCMINPMRQSFLRMARALAGLSRCSHTGCSRIRMPSFSGPRQRFLEWIRFDGI